MGDTQAHDRSSKKVEYVRGELDKLSKRFEKESSQHKSLDRGLRYIALGLTLVSTILAALALGVPSWRTGLDVGLVVVAGAVATVTGIDTIRRPRELWIHERTIHYALVDLLRLLDYRTLEPVTEAQIDALFEQLQATLGSSGQIWQDVAKRPLEKRDDT